METYTKDLLREQLASETAWLEDRIRNLERAKEAVTSIEDSILRVRIRIAALKKDLGEN